MMKAMTVGVWILGWVGASASANLPEIPLVGDRVRADVSDVVVARTTETPAKVEIEVPVSFGTNVCTGGQVTRTREVEVLCRESSRYGDQRNGNYPNGQPAAVYGRGGSCYQKRSEDVCLAQSTVNETLVKTLVIKFKNAPDLATGERETFRISVKQAAFDSRAIDFSGEPLETKGVYRTKEKSFLGNRIVFTAE